MKRLQLEDISRQLGYSKTLISMVINGKGNKYGISQKTQTLVLDAISKLNYAPNKFAKSLRTGKSYFIGLIVSDLANPFYSKIAKSIEEVVSAEGYNLMVCSSNENEGREKLLVEMMVNQQGVDGIIVASTLNDSSFYEHPRLAHLPVLFIDRIVPMLRANYVVIDNYGGSLEIMNHLIKNGRSRIVCFAVTPIHISTIEDRLNGYRIAMAKAGLEDKYSQIKEINHLNIEEDVEKCFVEFLKQKNIPDAIYALNNSVAMALLKLQGKKEFARLSKIKIACFDDVDLFNLIETPVCSVSQPIEEIGEASANMLLDIIAGRHGKTNMVLNTTLIAR
ncbi:MAG: LacI family DNA-binding transcriptional regulator [Bacteroidia bacterium]|nr:LacI family DNA-binding transcriptional regulator [Bacteroidia bacterium]